MKRIVLGRIGISIVLGSLIWASIVMAEVSAPAISMVADILIDSDHDGMPDDWEIEHGLLPNDAGDASLDCDADGLTNLEEYKIGSNPLIKAASLVTMAQGSVLAPITSQSLLTTTNRTILYDVSFKSPPNTVGGNPASGYSPVPRKMPTYYWPYGGEHAYVESVLGTLTNQPLVFRSGGQIEFGISDLPVYEAYEIDFDVYVDVMADTHINNSFSIILDTPYVKTLSIVGGGRAYTFPGYTWGTYPKRALIHITLTVDLGKQTWTIKLNDTLWPVQDLGAAQLRSVRFSLGTAYPPAIIGLDNILITGAHLPCVAVDDFASAFEDTPKVVDVLNNDYKGLGTLVVSNVTQGAHGVVTINPGKTNVTYAPAVDWHGTDTFSYVCCNQAGNTATAQVTLVVISVPDLTTEADPARHGSPKPFGYGTIQWRSGSVTNSVSSPVDMTNGTRYVCSGWTGTGSVPPHGSSNQIMIVLAKDSSLRWQWSREHLLTLQATNGCVYGAATGWKTEGFVYDLVPSNFFGYAFDHWETNGLPAGYSIPLTATITHALTVNAHFTPVYADVTPLVYNKFTAWELSLQTGTLFGQLIFSNRLGSAKHLIEPFHYAVAATSQVRLMHPAGKTLDGLDYIDITAQVLAQLPGVGNGDLVLDPGEAVIISKVEFYSFDRRPPTGFVYAVWCDPPGAAVPDPWNRDTDGDGIPNSWEKANGLCENDPLDGARDDDGDGLGNDAEYLANTNPQDPTQLLKMGTLFRRDNGMVLLNWHGGRSVTQYLEAAKACGGEWVAILTNVPPTETTNAVSVDISADRMMFYRIRVGR